MHLRESEYMEFKIPDGKLYLETVHLILFFYLEVETLIRIQDTLYDFNPENVLLKTG